MMYVISQYCVCNQSVFFKSTFNNYVLVINITLIGNAKF